MADFPRLVFTPTTWRMEFETQEQADAFRQELFGRLRSDKDGDD